MPTKTLAIVTLILFFYLLVFYHQPVDLSRTQYEEWKGLYGIRYENQLEDLYRSRIFMENLAAITEHNSNQ